MLRGADEVTEGGSHMYCGSCGIPLPKGARFCAKCGAPAEQTPVAAEASSRRDRGSTPSRVEYVPPGRSTPPPRSNRPVFWGVVAVAAVVIIAAGIAIPLFLHQEGDVGTASTTTGAPSSTAPSATTTSVPAPSTTVAAGPVGDSPGSWVELPIPGGPWAANDVAVSDDALLIQTTTATGYRLSAVMLASGDVVILTEAEAQWGMDIDGPLAVWWEGAAWDDVTSSYAEQRIYSYLLPSGPKTLVATGGGDKIGLPQVARPWVTWVLPDPWTPDPEYERERIMYVRVDDSGNPVGTVGVLVPAALAITLGDSSWQYSLSDSRVAWEHATAAEGYDAGTHVMGLDLGGHLLIGVDVWRPSLWDDTLVYWDSGLKVRDLAGGDTRDLDPSGDFATAGPTFAAYYRPSTGGSTLMTRGYSGVYQQALGELALPAYWCPVISVSAAHIAYAADTVPHLFEWQAH